MALISLVSAKGSPGCTTTALGLTMRWGRPAMLVEADIAGSTILAGFLRGQLHQDHGILQLALKQATARHVDVTDLWDQTLTIGLDPDTPAPDHTDTQPYASLLPGIPSAAQASAARSLWGDLAASLRSLDDGGVDAIVDVGRYDPRGHDDRGALLALSDQIILLTRSRLPDVQAAVGLTEHLHTRFGSTTAEISPLGLVVVGPGQPYDAGEIAEHHHMRLLGTTSWDPVSAEVYSLGSRRGRRFDSSSLNRSLDALAGSIRSRVASRSRHIAGTPDGGRS